MTGQTTARSHDGDAGFRHYFMHALARRDTSASKRSVPLRATRKVRPHVTQYSSQRFIRKHSLSCSDIGPGTLEANVHCRSHYSTVASHTVVNIQVVT